MRFAPPGLARASGAFALILGMLAMLWSAHAVVAQGNSSITVHNRVCPTNYMGSNYFDDCHDTPLDAGYEFTFTNMDTGETRIGTTNADGDVGFANLSGGTYSVVGGPPGDATETFAYCAVGTEANSNREQVSVDYVSGGIRFVLPADTNVICDWYTIPLGQSGQTPTAATQPERFAMPVYTLLCADDPGASAGDFVMGGVVPEGCEPYAGASVTIATQAGDVYGTCVTEGANPCSVNVDIGGTVVATIDPATLPTDYTVLGSQTQQVEVPPASEAWTLFVAVPAVQTPTPVPETTETPVVEGRTVAIHTGTCAPSEPGAVVAELPDLTGPEVGPDTETDVVLAETSSSVVDLALSDIMTGEHALIAYTDDAAETPVACTALAGELNGNGELVLGLREVNDSGYAGIVYLGPADETNQTRISVFLAEGLAADAHDRLTPGT